MTALPQLLDAAGQPVPLGHQIGDRGGEGIVYALLNDVSRVAKVYHQLPTPQTVEKLTAMVGLVNPQLLSVAAWPSGLLYSNRSRQVAGFVMPRLTNCQVIQHLYNPVMRLKHFPKAGWSFQVRAALNTAAAFDEAHKAGCVVGDVNLLNVLVSSQALVRLIDCDSFQVRANGKQFLCEVGVPHYTPPELQGKSFSGLVRTENHDRFGLAVLIYQLLFVGRHPYAGYQGRDDPTAEQLIAEFRFSQGPLAHTWDMGPPPFTPTFADIPPDLGLLFRRAFERGSESGTRPRPGEWMAALQQLERNTAEYAADPGHKYWKGANGCVWCRLANKGGPEYYFGVAGGTGTFEVDEKKLQEVLRRLAACQLAQFPRDPKRYTSSKAPEPELLPDGLQSYRDYTVVLGTTIVICLFLIPLGIFRAFISVIGLLGITIFGIWFMIIIVNSPWRRERVRRQRIYDRKRHVRIEMEYLWERTVWQYQQQHTELIQSVDILLTECQELGNSFKSELSRLSSNYRVCHQIWMRQHACDIFVCI